MTFFKKNILFPLAGAALILAAASCGGAAEEAEPVGAVEQGRADAKALCDANYTAERDLHAALLAVKSREWEMRRSGDSIAAAAYIDAFKAELLQSDQTLASKVF